VDVELEQHIRLYTMSSGLCDMPTRYFARDTSVTHIFKSLESSVKDTVRGETHHFFHRIQKHLILQDFGGKSPRHTNTGQPHYSM